jgi:GTPase SAR1 family protein
VGSVSDCSLPTSLYTSAEVLDPLWFSEGQGFILVYSIASRATFDRLEGFRQNMVRVKRTCPAFILVGNKCDKTYEREVSHEEGAALARQFDCMFLEASAKTAANIDRLFTDLVRMLRYEKELQANGGTLPQGSTSVVYGANGNKIKKSKSSKCRIL